MSSQFLIEILNTPPVRGAIIDLIVSSIYATITCICWVTAGFLIRHVAGGFVSWGNHNRMVKKELLNITQKRNDISFTNDSDALELSQQQQRFDEETPSAKLERAIQLLKDMVKNQIRSQETELAKHARFLVTHTQPVATAIQPLSWVRFIRTPSAPTLIHDFFVSDGKPYPYYRHVQASDVVWVKKNGPNWDQFTYILPGGSDQIGRVVDVEHVHPTTK